MKFNFLFTILLIYSIATAQTKGTVYGTITDKEANNTALPFANVMIKESSTGVTSDEAGKYSLNINPGSYILVFSFLGYDNIEVPITIAAGEKINVDKAMGSGGYKLQDVVIKSNGGSREKETALLLDQKKAVEIKQSIGAQEMSRKGISDVEEGLTKITGITKVGNRGLFVRGLEDRYNNLLINNLAVPSNNPFKKIIPLDLIPTDVVSIIETYKTFNPNIYGDFAGATFNLVTLKPTKSITKFSVGTGFTTNNNMRDFYFGKNTTSTKGFFGFAGNDRDLPSEFGTKPYPPVTLSRNEAINAFNNGFEIEKSKSPLNSSFGILHAEKFNIKDNKLSYLISLNFDNSYQFRTGADRTLQAGNSIEFSNNFQKTTYNYKTNISSILGLNYSTDRLNLSTTLLYLKSTDSQIQDQLGYQNNQQDVNNYLIRTNQLDESDYLNGQLFGEYFLTATKNQSIKGGFSLAKTDYNQPDRNSYTGSQVSENQINTSYGGNNFLRQFLDINSSLFSSAFVEYNLKFGKDHKLTFGYNGNHNFTISKYRFIQTITSRTDYNPNGIINPFDIDNQINTDLLDYKISFQESSNANWKSKLEETVNAGYTDLFYKFSDKFDVNAGIRFESYDRITKFKDIGSFDQKYKKKTANEIYFLPSLNAKYSLNETMNLRFASSLTYTKPVIMESFPISIVNPDGTVFQGNPFIENSKNLNIDIKYEVFPTNKELFAVGVFGKSIDKPIERTFIANPGTTILSFLNSDKATLYGIEAEVLLDLGRLSKSLKDVSWGFNTSIMQTNVIVPSKVISPSGELSESIETHKDRELQGASKWLINSDLKYQFNINENWTNTLSVVYSVFGKRIYSVGTAGIDHIYELPVSKLDLILTSKLSQHLDLKIGIDNILNPKTQLELGDNNTNQFVGNSNTIQDFRKGIGFSFNLSYTL